MNFTPTTCALCDAACDDRHLIMRDGPGLGPHVALCELCCSCGRLCEEIWALLAAKQVPAQIEEEHDGKA